MLRPCSGWAIQRALIISSNTLVLKVWLWWPITSVPSPVSSPVPSFVRSLGDLPGAVPSSEPSLYNLPSPMPSPTTSHLAVPSAMSSAGDSSSPVPSSVPSPGHSKSHVPSDDSSGSASTANSSIDEASQSTFLSSSNQSNGPRKRIAVRKLKKSRRLNNSCRPITKLLYNHYVGPGDD